MDTEEYLKTIKEKTEDMRRCMTIRNKFERWNEDFVPLDDMSIDQLCEYYESTKEILNKQLTTNHKSICIQNQHDPHWLFASP